MPQHFFNGDQQGTHSCFCAETNSCLKYGPVDYTCNCDAKIPEWTMDEGYITAKDILPITELFYGPMLYSAERANFTVGKLYCSGNDNKNIS